MTRGVTSVAADKPSKPWSFGRWTLSSRSNNNNSSSLDCDSSPSVDKPENPPRCSGRWTRSSRRNNNKRLDSPADGERDKPVSPPRCSSCFPISAERVSPELPPSGAAGVSTITTSCSWSKPNARSSSMKHSAIRNELSSARGSNQSPIDNLEYINESQQALGVLPNKPAEPPTCSRSVANRDKTEFKMSNFVGVFKNLDANRYATTKTLAQGMMDLTLLTTNASQLKYLLQVGRAHEFYDLLLTLLSLSMTLQLTQGLICVFLGWSLNINKEKDQKKANVWNNIYTTLMMLTLAINAVISGFEVRDSSYLQLARNDAGSNTENSFGSSR